MTGVASGEAASGTSFRCRRGLCRHLCPREDLGQRREQQDNPAGKLQRRQAQLIAADEGPAQDQHEQADDRGEQGTSRARRTRADACRSLVGPAKAGITFTGPRSTKQIVKMNEILWHEHPLFRQAPAGVTVMRHASPAPLPPHFLVRTVQHDQVGCVVPVVLALLEFRDPFDRGAYLIADFGCC